MRTLALLATLLALTAFAADKKEKTHDLRDFAWGKSVSGPSATMGKLNGKAVVLECWGVKCPPCIASLPHMQELSEKYKDTLVVIGAECQGHTAKEIAVVTKKAGGRPWRRPSRRPSSRLRRSPRRPGCRRRRAYPCCRRRRPSGCRRTGWGSW